MNAATRGIASSNQAHRLFAASALGLLVVFSALTLSAQLVTAATSPPFNLVWGTQGAASGEFEKPNGLAVDAAGNVYVADRNNNRIQKFDADGVHLQEWGTLGTGNGQFDSPRDIAIDSNGNIFVTDTDNDRVQKFDSGGTFLLAWGTLGLGDGQFQGPRGIAIDAADNVYVTEDGFPNKRVQKFTNMGVFISKWGSFGSGDGQFQSPRGIAIGAGGFVYVTDALSNRVQKFSDTGTFITKWGVAGNGDGQFNLPIGIDAGPCCIWVVDSQNNRVQVFQPDGTYMMQFGTGCNLATNAGCVDPDGGGPLALGDGQFNEPVGIAVPSAFNVYVTDTENNRAEKFGDAVSATNDGLISIGSVRVFPNPAASEVQLVFDLPAGLRLESERRVQVSVFDIAGRLVREWETAPRGDTVALTWDGNAQNGLPTPHGIYFARVRANGQTLGSAKIVRVE